MVGDVVRTSLNFEEFLAELCDGLKIRRTLNVAADWLKATCGTIFCRSPARISDPD